MSVYVVIPFDDPYVSSGLNKSTSDRCSLFVLNWPNMKMCHNPSELKLIEKIYEYKFHVWKISETVRDETRMSASIYLVQVSLLKIVTAIKKHEYHEYPL